MIVNYLKIAFRNFIKDFRFSIVNILGLTLGILCILIIFLYISYEKSYDNFHQKGDNIYLMGWKFVSAEYSDVSPCLPAGPAPDMYEAFPQIESFCRLRNRINGYLSFQHNDFYIEDLVYADTGIFDLFDFQILEGDIKNSLKEPFTIILTKSLAKKIYGDKDPIGETVKWNNQENYIITGIIDDAPSNSHIQFSALASFSSLYKMKDIYLGWNGGNQFYSYFLFQKGVIPEDIRSELDKMYFEKINHYGGWEIIPYFEPLKDIYLHPSTENVSYKTGNSQNSTLFFIIGIFILILACINFMNLTTARYISRSKELGIRKVIGATRLNIIKQFWSESIFYVTISCIISLILLEALIPKIQLLTGSHIMIYTRNNLIVLLSIPLLIFITGTISSSYPSLYLSKFSPVQIIYSRILAGRKRQVFRNLLVVFQFFVGVCLIICTICVSNQRKFMLKKDLGFEKENLLVLPMTSRDFREKQVILQDELRKLHGVLATAATSYHPGISHTAEGYKIEGHDESVMINRISVDHNYIQTMEMKIVEGRDFSRQLPSDSTAFIVNKSLVKKMGWKTPLEETIFRNGINHKIIGVVDDFHYSKLNSPIEPLIINLIPYYGFNYMLIRYKSDNLKDLINNIKTTWKSLDPDEPFDFSFADENIQSRYEQEMKLGQLFTIFSIIAIIIASLGLFGLVAFEAEKRRKEIGIRKTMGSTVNEITNLFIRRFILPVILGNIIAWPVAYYLMSIWMNNYAYKAGIHYQSFLIAAIISIVITIITIWGRSRKIANLNPVDSIRYE